MEKKKGFTLIELLAIIVILAIIAVITVPLILGIIDDSKEKASIASAYGFKEGIEKDYAKKLLNNNEQNLNGTYTISNGKLGNVDLPIAGTKPTNGTLTYQNNKLVSGCLTIDGYKVQYQNDKFTATKGDCNAALVCAEGQHAESTEFELNNDPVLVCEYLLYTDGPYYFSIDEPISDEDAHTYCTGGTIEVDNQQHNFSTDQSNQSLENLVSDLTYLGVATENNGTYTLDNSVTSTPCKIFMGWSDIEFGIRYCNGEVVQFAGEDYSFEDDMKNDPSLIQYLLENNIIRESSEITCVANTYTYYAQNSVQISTTLPNGVNAYVYHGDNIYLCGKEGGQEFCISNNYSENATTLNTALNCGLTEQTVQEDFDCVGNDVEIIYSEEYNYYQIFSDLITTCGINIDNESNEISNYYCADGK